MHINDHVSSTEIANLFDLIGGDRLDGSGFEAEQPETDFGLNDPLDRPDAEVRL